MKWLAILVSIILIGLMPVTFYGTYAVTAAQWGQESPSPFKAPSPWSGGSADDRHQTAPLPSYDSPIKQYQNGSHYNGPMPQDTPYSSPGAPSFLYGSPSRSTSSPSRHYSPGASSPSDSSGVRDYTSPSYRHKNIDTGGGAGKRLKSADDVSGQKGWSGSSNRSNFR